MTQKRPDRPDKIMRNRLRWFILIFAVAGFTVVAAKLFYMQVIHTNFYQSEAAKNQTKDLIITPTRGTIYDRDMTELAVSATTQEISVDPQNIRKKGERSTPKRTDEKGKTIPPTDAEIKESVLKYQQRVAAVLADHLELNYQETLKKIQKDTSYVRIARRVDADIADELQAELDEQKLSGVYMLADSKRYYQNGMFASQVIGFTSDDGEGLNGIELQYNDVLKGVAGRVVKATNALGSDMPFEYEKYIEEQDGDGVVLTIDQAVQHYLEKHLETALNGYQAKKGVCGIVMDITTGEILAMSTKPDFNLNDPRSIPEEYTQLLAELNNLSGEKYQEKYSEILLRLWRNKAINDTYEPGSTFKVFTVSSALESGVVSDSSTFQCGGSKIVEDRVIRCWKHGGHGSQSLGQTLENSCNVAMMDIGAMMGTDIFRKFFEGYGLMEKTGIDLPGEANGIFFDHDMGVVDLATASFGQNFQVTPLQELCMVSAACNGGNLIVPHIAKEIVDPEGNVKQVISTDVKRQVISENTSDLMRGYLEDVVAKGTGQNAYVAGYRVGGKTATSQKQPKSDDSLRIASFIGVAPMDDPQYAVLVMIDEPQTDNKGGGALAAPICARIFEDILPYLGVEAIYSEEESNRQEISVPSLTGRAVEDVKAELEKLGLEYRIKGDGEMVTAQLPVAGILLQPANKVVLYCDADAPTEKVEVPDVRGMTVAQARQQLADYGLYLKQNGVADWRLSGASVGILQSPAAGSKIMPGSVITVAFGNNVTSQE